MGLAAGLRQQHQHLGKLRALLARERTLLNEGQVDGDALALLATEKQAVLETLDNDERQRREACRQLGCADNQTGDDEAARQAGCLELWLQVRGDALQAAQANYLNGELISVRMANNQQLLNQVHALIGKNLYGPDGQARGSRTRLSSTA